MSKVIEVAKKIKALADQGVGGERENAQRMLGEWCVKHGISIEEIEGEITKEYEFAVPAKDERLFRQVVSSVMGRGIKFHGYKHARTKARKEARFISMTAAEYAEIDMKFQFYRKKLEEDMEIFFNAFIQVNELYVKATGDEESKKKELTADERAALMKVMGLQMVMDKHKFHKQISQ